MGIEEVRVVEEDSCTPTLPAGWTTPGTLATDTRAAAACDDEKAAFVQAPGDDVEAGEGAAATDAAEAGDAPPYRSAMLVTLAVFCGYANFVTFQHKLKDKMGIDDCDHHRQHVFEHACSLNYIGNFIFRIAHNFVFGRVSPRVRVYISLSCMMVSQSILGLVIVVGGSDWIGWVFIAYFLGGVSIGTYESNMLTCITPLGKATKVWTIIGMPTGFALICIGGFAFTAFGGPLVALYLFVVGMCVASMCVFTCVIPNIPIQSNSLSWPEFVTNLKQWRDWLPVIKWNCLALAAVQFFGSFFGGIMFYLLNDDNYVGLWGRLDPIGKHSDSTVGRMNHDWFFVVFNTFIFFGDSLSRKLVYWHRAINPLWYLIISVIGTALNLSQIPIFSWPGIFLVYYANGAVYGTSTRYIDAAVAKRFNLIALSFWLFIGDMGSVTGSNIWQSVQDRFCDGVHDHLKYMCVPDGSSGSC